MSDKCFWPKGCSDKRRCDAFGGCVAAFQSQHKEAYVNIERLQARIKVLEKILETAPCPNCDGSGTYYDSMGEVCQCQWCYGKGLIPASHKGREDHGRK